MERYTVLGGNSENLKRNVFDTIHGAMVQVTVQDMAVDLKNVSAVRGDNTETVRKKKATLVFKIYFQSRSNVSFIHSCNVWVLIPVYNLLKKVIYVLVTVVSDIYPTFDVPNVYNLRNCSKTLGSKTSVENKRTVVILDEQSILKEDIY